MQPVSKAAARVLDFLTRDLANPCGEGVSSRRLGKKGDTYMPVSVERIGETIYSVAHYVEQNGDLCPDPAMTFRRREDGSWLALSIQQLWDGCVEHYGITIDENEKPSRIDPRRAADIRKFTTLWMKNVKTQQGIKLPRQPRGPKRVTVASIIKEGERTVDAWLAEETEAFIAANNREPRSAREVMEWSPKAGREGILRR